MTQQRSSPPASRATIEDVAAAANVSVATVSRALRGLPNVAASTRSRVVEVAAQLNYQADPAARRLATGRSHAIAVLVPFVNTWYCAEVMAGVEAVCAEAGYDMVVIALRTVHSRLCSMADHFRAVMNPARKPMPAARAAAAAGCSRT